MNTPYLETDRLILRKFNEDDIDFIFQIYANEKVNTYLPWFPITNLEQATAIFTDKYLEYYQVEKGYRYAICLKQDNLPIGYIHVNVDNDSHDFGYGLLDEYWNNGIITEASQEVLKRLQSDGIKYITATHDRSNSASGKVMKKLGMVYKYSYLEDWQPKDIKVVFRMYQLNFDANDEYIYDRYLKLFANNFIEEI